MASKKLLIAGATGKQGGAVIDALISRSTPTPFQILALTRNRSTAKAGALAARSDITIVEGNLSSPALIFAEHSPIHGVFLVTSPGKEGAEEAQAEQLITLAVTSGVEHFIFTSVDRSGPQKDFPTSIRHFASKHRIEELLREKAAGTQMRWTILRPVTFMDNLTPDFMGRMFASMWADVGDAPLQLVSVHDIGVFAASAFEDPEAYEGRAVGLAGDELSFAQGKIVFKETMGFEMPQTFWFVSAIMKLMVKEMDLMSTWLKYEGCGVDIPSLRKEEPRLQNFEMWLRESSQFKEKYLLDSTG
jgi:uncharacterized protein YbjT (DUF2867 family)